MDKVLVFFLGGILIIFVIPFVVFAVGALIFGWQWKKKRSWKWGIACLASVFFAAGYGMWFFGSRQHVTAAPAKPYVPEVVTRAVVENQEVIIVRSYGGFVDVGSWLELYRFPLNMSDSEKWSNMQKYYVGPIEYDDRFQERPDLNVPREVVAAKIDSKRKTILFTFNKGKDQTIQLVKIVAAPHPNQ